MANLKWYSSLLFMQINQISQEALEEIGDVIVADIQASMKPGNYRLWRSKTGKGWHYSSTPPAPPAPDTQRLKKSISWAGSWGKRSGGKQYGAWGSRGGEVVGDRVRRPYPKLHMNILDIGTRVPYWAVHEFGYGKLHLPPRPYLVPAYRRNRHRIANLFKGRSIMSGVGTTVRTPRMNPSGMEESF